jgi:NAD(P)-dependent dehydrogenase (short-subunit alcohol dehydrogenase family)
MDASDFPRFDLNGQVALVTGAARGIGRACALTLAHAGADVALGLRDPNTVAELAREIENMGRRDVHLPLNVTQLDQVRQAVSATAGSGDPQCAWRDSNPQPTA